MEEKIRFSGDDVVIDRLRESDKVELSDFSCGDEECYQALNRFFREDIFTCNKYHYVSAYCVRQKSTGCIVAVFTLANDSIVISTQKDKEGLKEEIGYVANDEYKYILENQDSFPAVNIAHLGVRADVRRSHIGFIVLDFIVYSFLQYEVAGCQFITVDSINNKDTNAFYASYGFVNLSDSDAYDATRRMYLILDFWRMDQG